MSYDVFVCVLGFLYTGKLRRDVSSEMAVEVMGVANLYTIEPLKHMCADVLARGVNVENAACLLHAADAYSVPHLRTLCMNFMVSHFAAVVGTEGFAELIATAVGARVFSLRVRGHEKNCILLAVKRADGDAPRPSAGKADARTLEALRQRLRAAASEHAAAQTEAALVESMRGNAATLEVWLWAT